ncbi:hypothetical protein BGZ63DRAFT_390699 [Mariannaea sp. PMI_226]|nr:hypothetical protein BGZ63DRAFT_390699 [Mariannaea sp. PMI_226]
MPGKVVSRDEWLAARKAFLEKEKELTRANDALSAERRDLPMVKVDKEYTFHGPDNKTYTLSDLFDGQEQLIVYHFMFKPGDDEGCRGCSHIGDQLPDVRHLQLKNTNLVCISRGDIDKLEAFKKRNDWTFPWYSSGNSDFNYDFHATLDESVCPIELNFRSKEELEKLGKSMYTGDVPGLSVFWMKDGEIYHTYSTFARGGEKLMPTLALLDMTPLGRQIGKYGPAEFKLKDEY